MELPVIIKFGGEQPRLEPCSALLSTEVPAAQILVELEQLLRLPAQPSGQPYPFTYSLRREKHSRLLPAHQTILDGRVRAGEALIIEPTVRLSNLLDYNLPRLQGNGPLPPEAWLPRLHWLHNLLPAIGQVAQTLERELAQGYSYQTVQPATLLIKVNSGSYTGFIADLEKPELSPFYTSPEQRRNGFVMEESAILTNYVFSLSAVCYRVLTDLTTPVELGTRPEVWKNQLIQYLKGLGEPPARSLAKAFNAEARARYPRPTEFIADLQQTLNEWLEQNEWLQRALEKYQEPAGYDEALRLLRQIRHEYQTAWEVPVQIGWLEQQLTRQRLFNALAQVSPDQPGAELEILYQLQRIQPDAQISERIRQAKIRFNRQEANHSRPEHRRF